MSTTPRHVADRYVDAICDLDPIVATSLGTRPGDDRLPDFSPAGLEAEAALTRETLTELDRVLAADPSLVDDPIERSCARLLRERLGAELAAHEAGEGLRALSNLFSPVHSVRQIFSLMPAATEADWSVIARRMARVPVAYRGFRESLEEGARQELFVGPAPGGHRRRPARRVAGRPVLRRFRGDRPRDAAARNWSRPRGAADEAVAEIRDFLRDVYAPQAEGTPDAVGRERYATAARRWTGSDLGAGTAWRTPTPGAGPSTGGSWPSSGSRRTRSSPAPPRWRPCAGWARTARPSRASRPIREWLQKMMDDAIEAMDGTHFDLAEPVRRVEAMIAPPGSAAAPYYTRPAQDFSRPGRTWLPTLGRTRFPLWDLVSIWYHEGVPGHHLQLAQWAYVSGQLSTYQTSLGSVGANVEGWALYAERLMDELGYFSDPGERLGFLDAQQLRSVRVVIDIGMHLGLPIPDDAEGSLAAHRGRAVDAGAGAGVPGRELGRRPRRSSTASWSATSASRGRRSATSWGSGRGWRVARPRGRPGALTSTSRPGTWPRCHRARSASTTSRPSSPGCSRGAASARTATAAPQAMQSTDHDGLNPAQVAGNAKETSPR